MRHDEKEEDKACAPVTTCIEDADKDRGIAKQASEEMVHIGDEGFDQIDIAPAI
ncbi:MAG: hypothetical protein PHN82_10195 [bacterium]|nr:hypothetical protein [bacterium]